MLSRAQLVQGHSSGVRRVGGEECSINHVQRVVRWRARPFFVLNDAQIAGRCGGGLARTPVSNTAFFLQLPPTEHDRGNGDDQQYWEEHEHRNAQPRPMHHTRV
jgi:hypothetical protein